MVNGMESRFTIDRNYDVKFRNFNTDEELEFKNGLCVAHLYAGSEGNLELLGSSFMVPLREHWIHVQENAVIEANESQPE